VPWEVLESSRDSTEEPWDALFIDKENPPKESAGEELKRLWEDSKEETHSASLSKRATEPSPDAEKEE
jgi:hypothetical protein